MVVTVDVSGYGTAGALIETLPPGFSFVSSSTHSGAEANGQEVSFTLLGDSSVTYTVTASQTAGDHSFSGEVRGFDQSTNTVGGATGVTVEAASTATATPTPTATPASPPAQGSASASRSISRHRSREVVRSR